MLPLGVDVVAQRRGASVVDRPAKRGERTVDGIGRRLYGCLHGVGKPYLLNETGPDGISTIDPRTIRFAGDFVSYQQDWASLKGQGPWNTVAVRNLRTGRLTHEDYVTHDRGNLGEATAYALRRDGALAWVAHTYDENDETVTEVRAMTPDTGVSRDGWSQDVSLPLDSGRSIRPYIHFSKTHRSVFWFNSGVRRRALLP